MNGTAAANSTVDVYDGTTQIGTTTTNGNGTWSYTTGTLSDATHTFTARATDAAGNTGVWSAERTVTVDAVPSIAVPTIDSFSRDSNIADDGITNDNTLRLAGTAPANSTVRIYDGANQIGSTTASSSGSWSYWTGTVADGLHGFHGDGDKRRHDQRTVILVIRHGGHSGAECSKLQHYDQH